MAGMSVDGLISGLDTTALITQLLQAEAAPQTALKKRLTAAEIAASAYRTVNTSFAAVRTAAEAALAPGNWTATKASSSAASVTVSASAGAAAGSLTFSVDNTATAHSVVSGVNWTATTDPYGMTSPIEVRAADGTVTGTIAVGGTGTLADAVTAINGSGLGLTAAAVKVAEGQYRLQVTATTSGAAAAFDLGTAGTFAVTTQGVDATLTVGTGAGAYSVTSATNTFTGLMDGVTLTVGKTEPQVTVTVANDPDAAANNMQALVDAVNAALGTVKTYSSNAPGSTAALKGDFALRSLTGQLLDAASSAVGADGSPARLGLQLTRDGKLTFDKNTFLTALKDDPALVQRMVGGTPASNGADGVSGTADDLAAVSGIAGRLLDVAKAASDSATGSLTTLAKGKDSIGADLKTRIEAWDLRLAARKAALTRQFSAMETALSALNNQSSWLAGQLAALPSS